MAHVRESALREILNTNLCRIDTEGDELKTICKIMQPNNDDLLKAYSSLVLDIDHSFKHFISYQIIPFGSTISGLAFKDSDFDLYIVVNDMNIQKRDLKLIAEAMRQSKNFSNIIEVLNTRVPIIKCVHKCSGFSCDFSFGHSSAINAKAAVYNSNIIRQLLRFDRRVHPMAVILKCWTKFHHILGQSKITNYLLIMLIIFYLQSLETPIIPPLIKFQMGVKAHKIGLWNLTFDFKLKNRTTNKMSVADLVCGFFNFYKHFEYKQYVISPLFGYKIKRCNFEEEAKTTMPAYCEFLKQEGSLPLQTKTDLCVQDPFELAQNIASATSRSSFQLFKREVDYAEELINKKLAESILSAKILYALFNQAAPTQLNVIEISDTTKEVPGEKLNEENVVETENDTNK